MAWASAAGASASFGSTEANPASLGDIFTSAARVSLGTTDAPCALVQSTVVRTASVTPASSICRSSVRRGWLEQ